MSKILDLDFPALYKRAGKLCLQHQLETICTFSMGSERARERSIKLAQVIMNVDEIFTFIGKVKDNRNVPEELREAADGLLTKYELNTK